MRSSTIPASWPEMIHIVQEGKENDSMGNCAHAMKPHDLPLQKNALRIEIMPPELRCAMLPKTDQYGREYDVGRWVLSGGDPVTAAHPCVGGSSLGCPRNVVAEESIMNDGKSGPCPMCGTFNRRIGFGQVACRDCGYVFKLIQCS